jgi:hypothetical protein
LAPDSPALDAGDNADAPATDQRGYPRISGAAIDIGAYEASASGSDNGLSAFGRSGPKYSQPEQAGDPFHFLLVGPAKLRPGEHEDAIFVGRSTWNR